MRLVILLCLLPNMLSAMAYEGSSVIFGEAVMDKIRRDKQLKREFGRAILESDLSSVRKKINDDVLKDILTDAQGKTTLNGLLSVARSTLDKPSSSACKHDLIVTGLVLGMPIVCCTSSLIYYGLECKEDADISDSCLGTSLAIGLVPYALSVWFTLRYAIEKNVTNSWLIKKITCAQDTSDRRKKICELLEQYSKEKFPEI